MGTQLLLRGYTNDRHNLNTKITEFIIEIGLKILLNNIINNVNTLTLLQYKIHKQFYDIIKHLDKYLDLFQREDNSVQIW